MSISSPRPGAVSVGWSHSTAWRALTGVLVRAPATFDALTAITDWVTRGDAPDSLTTKSVDSGGNTTVSRPVYPFPYYAENTTGGSAIDASSYTPVESSAEADLKLDWLGSFRSGYETVGNWVGGKWLVTRGKS
ncbi:tannase/feruloyl esterase family alpha/beta hydrolase [Streptomyces sp. NPDC056660]|uniref:tannase/feruloyl esterase family alpha/beta hydrolase n=1 Tax=Streptomyces sp. NPDC056660 TaxID=3345897 RepID=UPI00367EE2EB